MANQPETATYDAGVYQIEVVDAVQGGVGGLANKPLLNLADRTAYLKVHMDALEAGSTIIPGVALLNGPALTGTPTAPPPAVGDNTTKIATTAFVQETVSGIATVGVSGDSNVVLTQAQWGFGIITFTGALTANISVTFPTQSDRWLIVNNTTGGFSLTCKTAAGTGVAPAQGYARDIYCDGTNISFVVLDRIRLLANITLFVATTGSDTVNSGLTAGSPFLTIQNAWNTIVNNYDINGFTATIQVADGTYNAGITGGIAPIGGGVVINGNPTTPSNVVFSTTSVAFAFFASGPGVIVQNFKIQTSGSGIDCIQSNSCSVLTIGQGMVFGAAGGAHVRSTGCSTVYITSAYSITGGAQTHWIADRNAQLSVLGTFTITLTGTPAFSVCFAQSTNGANIDINPQPTFSGAATGVRFSVNGNGSISSNGAGASYLPGNAPGTGNNESGGQYS